MSDYYILDGVTPVPVAGALMWAMRFKNATRRVAETDVAEGVRVSTVFLGLDHNFCGAGPPLLFETMCFGGVCDAEQTRASTWAEAEQQHARMVDRARACLLPEGKD